jgi:hypothetical protein
MSSKALIFGMALGVGLGSAFGIAIENPGVGLGSGIAIGVGLGVAIGAAKPRELEQERVAKSDERRHEAALLLAGSSSPGHLR